MPCYSPLKGFKNKETGGIIFKRCAQAGQEMEVACGSCLGCRLDRSRMWSMRIMHEAAMHADANGNSFITLTYNDDNLPKNNSLDKKHFQDFMKRLRKKNEQKIRFYHCGEYGELCEHGYQANVCNKGCNVGRPHYHAILFNKTFTDLQEVGKNTQGDIHYSSPELEQIWGKGFVQVGEVTQQSAAYVARYVVKKVNGVNQDDHYKKIDHQTGEVTFLNPEYSTMSRRPGIGLKFFEKYKTDMFPSDETPVPGVGVIKGTPRYYQEKMELEEPWTIEDIKRKRIQFRNAHLNEYTSDRLIQKYKVKLAQSKMLKREL